MFCYKFKSFLFNLVSAKCYIPKDATQQDIFLSKHPSFDGRGIKIAIIDSGVDVSLEGLQKTSEGHPKIIDCFDFTGAGDVDTSVIKEMDAKNYLIGLSGRKFKIPKNWINPSGKWHLGLKALFKPSLFPSKIPKTSKIPEKLPEIDCIVWFDGQKWCVCIETYKTDLKKSKVLSNFRNEHQYGIFFLKGFKIVYSVTVHNNGNLLEIFLPYCTHGSVVAQIAAANFPKNPEQNGLAPGAQIISFNVMDPVTGKLKDSEVVLKKALLKCIEMNIDIINYSISHFALSEETEKLITEMCNNHNILIFKSAGNDGPIFSSVLKHDKNVDDLIFKIGALLTSEMQNKIYNVKKEDDSNLPIVYAFSSRGPGARGSRGLDFVAPGAAVTKATQFDFCCCFQGTSFSSPNAAGAVACLLSGLKANSMQYSVASIKFALFKTAFLPENGNIFEFGHGIIQINSAFDYFCKNNAMIDSTIFNICKPVGIACGADKQAIMERSINLSNFINLENDATTSKFTLEVSQKSKNFIEVSEIDENNSFSVKVDTTKLEAGSFKDAEIMIMDPLIGSILNIPIFVVYAIRVNETQNLNFQKAISLNYEKPYRVRFYLENIKSCKIRISASKCSVTMLWMKYICLFSMSVQEAKATKKSFIFSPLNHTKTLSIPIKEEKEVFEICFYQKIFKFVANEKFKLKFNFKNDDQKEAAKVETV